MRDGAEDILNGVYPLDDQDVPKALLLLCVHLLGLLSVLLPLLATLDAGVVEPPLPPVPHDDQGLPQEHDGDHQHCDHHQRLLDGLRKVELLVTLVISQ